MNLKICTIVCAIAIAFPVAANAVTASPGGTTTFSGPITVTVFNSATNAQIVSYSCTASASGSVATSTGNLTISGSTFSVSSCSNYSGFGAAVSTDSSTWDGTTYSSGSAVFTDIDDFSIDVNADSTGFGPAAEAYCQGALANIAWTGSNTRTDAQASSISLPFTTLANVYPTLTAECTISGTLYISPFQAFGP